MWFDGFPRTEVRMRRKPGRKVHNDEERRVFSLSDEGLYRASLSFNGKGGMTAFVKANRVLIDEVMDNIHSGKKKEHYLVYG